MESISIIKDIKGGPINIIGNIHNTGSNISARVLDVENTSAFHPDDLANMLEDCQFLPELMEKASACLAQKRVLVLHGQAHIGKTTTALAVAQRVNGHAGTACRMTRPLPLQFKVNPVGLGEESDEMLGCALIFQDALKWRNQDILDFLHGMDTYQLEHQLIPRLQGWDGYLIFTGETASFTPVRRDLEDAGVMFEIAAPSPALFEQVLRIRLNRFREAVPDERKDAMSLLGKGNLEHLFRKLKTLPRLVRFLDHYGVDFVE